MSYRPTCIVLNLGPLDAEEGGRVVHHYRDAKQCADAWARAIKALEEPDRKLRRLPSNARTPRKKPDAPDEASAQ